MIRLIRHIVIQVRCLAVEEANLLYAVRKHYHAARLRELSYGRYDAPAYLRRRLVRAETQRA